MKTKKKIIKSKKRKKLKELPPIFSKISDRFASDYRIATQLHFYTRVKIDASRFPFSLIAKFPKEEDNAIFNKIFEKVVDNDEKLSILLKEAKIQNLSIDKE